MSTLELGNLSIDRKRFHVSVGEQPVGLTFVEFELLYQLARNAGQVLPRSRLMQAVWHERSDGEDRKLTVHMSRLRKKLRESDPWRIETTTKRGYALVDAARAAGIGSEGETVGTDDLSYWRLPRRESA